MPLAAEVALELVPTGPSLVREDELGRLALELADQLVQIALARTDGTDEVGRVATAGMGVSDGNGLLVNIQPDQKRSRLLHG